MRRAFTFLPVLTISMAMMIGTVYAEMKTYTITIKENRFYPEKLTVPAYEKIKLTVVNNDETPEEFESFDLNREKIIPGNSSGIIYIGPLKPGTYKYFGEFHPETAQGVIVAQEME